LWQCRVYKMLGKHVGRHPVCFGALNNSVVVIAVKKIAPKINHEIESGTHLIGCAPQIANL